MALADRLAADTAVLTANLNTLIAAASVVVVDTAAGATQPHVDALATAMATIAATRARIVRITDQP
jgi:MinD superfamily P-loop ATPase